MTRMMMALVVLSALDAFAITKVAVTYFDINGGTEEYRALGKGMADMLITDLLVVKSISLVERAKLNLVMDELKLAKSPYVDKATALKLGKVLSATHMLTGAITVLGTKMRIDARVLDATSGVVVQSKQVDGESKEFFDLEKELVDLLVAALDLKPDQKEKAALRKSQTESFDAWARYSAGLDATDKGDPQKAQQLFLEALQADPNYRSAKNASERLAALYAKVDQAQVKGFDAAFKKLNPKAKDFAAQVEQLLIESDTTREDGMKQKLALLTWLAERDLLPQSSPHFSRVALDAMALIGRFTRCPDEYDAVLQSCDYFAQRIPKDQAVLGMCRSNLDQINRSRKDPKDVESQRGQWARDYQEHRNLDPENWMGVLARNREGIAKLMHLYASKAKK